MLVGRFVLRACRTVAVCQRGLVSIASHHNSNNRLVKSVIPKPDDGLLTVTWDNGTTNRYPFVYLRDNCQCPECFHDSSKQRSFDTVAGLDASLVTSEVDVQIDGKQVSLKWPDNHVSSFNSDWLYKRRLPEGRKQLNMENHLIEEDVQLWDHKLTDNVPTLQFDEVLNSPSSQLRWLDLVHRYGITLIKNAPKEPGQVQKLGETLGFLKEMWFGESQQICNDLNENDRNSLTPQSSSSYNEYRGGFHLIHCQKQVQGQGGEHTFVDGFQMAQELYNNEPDLFELLCTSPIMYQRKAVNKSVAYDMAFSRPIIRLRSSGRLASIIYNDTNRVAFSRATPDEIPKLYRAYYELTNLIRDTKHTIKYKLQEGDIMSYDCDRVFSGREAFAPEVKGPEVFENAFTDKDMTLSRRKTLKANLQDEVD